MTELVAYRTMIESASRDLRATISELDAAQFGRRPLEGANPVNFIYFHVLRHWDRDINVFCRRRAAEADVWHRMALSRDAGYEPLGKGNPPIGTGYGYSADEVDEVPADPQLFLRYQDLLHEDTMDFLDSVDPGDFNTELRSGTGDSFTIGARLRHLIAHTYLHCGDIEYAKGLIGAQPVDIPSIR